MSDLRWAGGLANREWARGHAAAREPNPAELTAGVRAYLADCQRHQAILAAAYHPTPGGCLKAVHHIGATEAGFIRAAYVEITTRGEGREWCALCQSHHPAGTACRTGAAR